MYNVPAKKIGPQTDASFDRLKVLHAQTEADAVDEVLRLSLEVKARVKIGLFSRSGKS